MTGAEKLFISLLVIVGALIYNLFFSKAATIKRKIRNSSGKKISAFEDGETAKVIGEIKYIGKTLNAPLSGRRCVYYHVLVEQEKSIGARTPYWSTIVEEEEAGDVIIKDGPHYAFIQTNLVKSHLIEDANYSSGIFKDATHVLEKYLAKHGHASSGLLGINKRIRYTEGILEEGELLAVVGKGTWQKKDQLKFKIPAEKFLLISADNEEPVYFSDDPEITDAAE